jgi:hypothetical protein
MATLLAGFRNQDSGTRRNSGHMLYRTTEIVAALSERRAAVGDRRYSSDKSSHLMSEMTERSFKKKRNDPGMSMKTKGRFSTIRNDPGMY